MNYFEEGYEELHNDAEQMLRQERAGELEINWTVRTGEDGNAILTGKGQARRIYMYNGRLQTCRIKDYLVSLESCTCRDFELRQVPCKHMYKLASRAGLFVRRDERSRELIADFSTDYAAGWAFTARKSTYDALQNF